MTPLFKKLNLAADARSICVLNPPGSFDPEIAVLEGVAVIREVKAPVAFVLAFVVTYKEVEVATEQLTRAAQGDAVIWMVYPKGTSKKYKCEFKRETGFGALGQAGYEPVRQVAIDDDWSALRFRKAAFIKTMTRNPDGAISEAGRAKAIKGAISTVKENKTKETNASVDAYLAAIEDDARRADCEALVKMMSKVTKQPAKMWGTSIVGFGTYHYVYESGREGDACLTGFASRKGDISIYLICGSATQEVLLAKLGRHKMGKACLYVRRLSEVDLMVLEQLVAESVAEVGRRYAS